MIIRDFKQSDLESFCAMSRDFYTCGAALKDIPDKNRINAFNEIINGSPCIRGLIFEENNETIGYALLTFFYSCEAGSPMCLIDEIYFKKEHRGRGNGTQYLNWVFKTYPRHSFRLEVMPGKTDAIKLYKKMGFESLDYLQLVKIL